jgi:hypothetical protein
MQQLNKLKQMQISSMPNVANTVDDLAQHQTNMNQAIEQVMKGRRLIYLKLQVVNLKP